MTGESGSSRSRQGLVDRWYGRMCLCRPTRQWVGIGRLCEFAALVALGTFSSSLRGFWIGTGILTLVGGFPLP